MKLNVQLKKDFEFFQDGKPVEMKREGDVHVADLREDENGEVRFTVLRRSEFSSPLWFVWCLFFWIVGIFGIFTKGYSRSTARVTANIKVPQGHADTLFLKMSALPDRGREKGVAAFSVGKDECIVCDDWCFNEDRVAARRRLFYTLVFGVVLRIAGIVLVAWAIGSSI